MRILRRRRTQKSSSEIALARCVGLPPGAVVVSLASNTKGEIRSNEPTTSVANRRGLQSFAIYEILGVLLLEAAGCQAGAAFGRWPRVSHLEVGDALTAEPLQSARSYFVASAHRSR